MFDKFPLPVDDNGDLVLTQCTQLPILLARAMDWYRGDIKHLCDSTLEDFAAEARRCRFPDGVRTGLGNDCPNWEVPPDLDPKMTFGWLCGDMCALYGSYSNPNCTRPGPAPEEILHKGCGLCDCSEGEQCNVDDIMQTGGAAAWLMVTSMVLGLVASIFGIIALIVALRRPAAALPLARICTVLLCLAAPLYVVGILALLSVNPEVYRIRIIS